MSCYYAGAERPRALRNRHADDCAGDDCRGCEPCPWGHCRICSVTHAEHTCPGCLSETREAISEIRRLCAGLPAEVAIKGIDSEAMNLLGPVADPESIGHMRASVNVGRIPADWLEIADHELHPLLVLGTWMEAYIEAFEHPEPAGRITVVGAASYLERNLSYASTFADVPFEDFARNLRQCQTHMERVLHDGEQIETGAPCMTCRVPLQIVRDKVDYWKCPKCRQTSTEEQYRFAVQHLHREEADWLTDQEMEIRTGVRAGTVREWARNRDDRDALVSKRRDSGRVVYLVADVERVAGEKGMMSA